MYERNQMVQVQPRTSHQLLVDGAMFRVEGEADSVLGARWLKLRIPAVVNYVLRRTRDGLPVEGTVFYGKIGPLGYLVHEDEMRP